ncbi:MAG: hypothetical protein R6V67_06975, partial [Spirochaetia bacterium]
MGKNLREKFRISSSAILISTAVFLIVALSISGFLIFRKVNELEREVAHLTDEEKSAQEERDQNSSEEEEIFQKAVESIDELMINRNAETTKELFAVLTAEEGSASIVNNTGLRFRFDGDLHGTLFRNGRSYFSIRGDKIRGEVKIESLTEDTISVEHAGEEVKEFVLNQRNRLDRIVENEEEMREEIESSTEEGETSELIESKDMDTTRIVKDEFVLRRGITNSGGAVIVRIEADAENRRYRVDGEQIEEAEQLNEAIHEAVKNYDPQEEIRRSLEKLESRLSVLLDDEGFKRYLKERKLEISSTPEEESPNNSVHRYPITTENGDIAGSVVLDPEEGVISLEDRQEKTEQTIDEIMVSHGLGGGSAQDA